MKLLVAGSRNFRDRALFEKSMAEIDCTEIVSGGAMGPDSWAIFYANKAKVPVKIFYAQWEIFGRAAGFMRNTEMATYADQAVVFWDGVSRGSKHMIEEMKRLNKPVSVVMAGQSFHKVERNC